jgi:hypothetical protein
MVKRVDQPDEWQILDNKRNPVNPRNTLLNAQDNEAEVSVSNFDTNFLATGFEQLTNDNGSNASGGTYIYMAFA